MEKKNRITKADRFNDIKFLLKGEIAPNGTTVDDAIIVLDHELELLAKKNSGGSNGPKKPTATQIENENLKNLICDYLRENPDGATCTQILKAIPELGEYQVQKVSGLVRQMGPKGDGRVTSKEVKGKPVFMLA
jgi:hypothetical protein